MSMRGEQLNFGGFMVPRADLKPEYFDTLIRQKGYNVLWQQGMFCSCYESVSGQPDYNCEVCRGKGYVYFGDTMTRAIVTSINGRKEQENIGLHDIGTAYLTPLSVDAVGYKDKFTFPDFYTKYSEVITRNEEGYIDYLRYKCKGEGMIALRQLDQIYREGIDFKIVTDDSSLSAPSAIHWINTIRPGTKYSVLYFINPVYVAINPIHELRGTYSMYKGGGEEYFVKLPNQFMIKREDFLENGVGVQYNDMGY